MTSFADMEYDFGYIDEDSADSDHLFEIFRIKGGEVVDYADSAEEAQEKIAKLEKRT